MPFNWQAYQDWYNISKFEFVNQMFTKPLSLIAVYILTIFNFTILFMPILASSIPLIMMTGQKVLIYKGQILPFISDAIILLLFLVSFMMLLYLFFDYLFGFSVRSALKKCTRHTDQDDYGYLDPIFNQVKTKFGESSAKLYIKHIPEINAFAIGGLGRKYIVLTDGLLKHYRDNSANEEEFLTAIRSIMGHEMSHLINKDFLPALIIIVNQKATNFAADLLAIILRFSVSLFTYARIKNRYTSILMVTTYNITTWLLTAFNHYIVYNVYEFLRRFMSRSIEYRCDRQSAIAFGGENMAFALSFLGQYGYFTIFSTHPNTDNRIKNVQDVEVKDGVIRTPLSSIISNYISMMFLVLVCAICAKLGHVDIMVRKYLINNHEEIYYYFKYLAALLKKLVLYHY